MRARQLAICILVLSLACPLLAQSPTENMDQVTSEVVGGAIALYTSAVTFPVPDLDSVVLVEFPFAVNRNGFDFFRPDTSDPNLYARIFAQVVVLRPDGFPVDSFNTYFSARAANATEAAARDNMLFNKLTAFLKPGIYSARLTVIDVVSKRIQEAYISNFEVAMVKERLNIGGPALAYRISRITDSATMAGHRMAKGGYLVLNDPLGVYKTADSTAFLYAEIYNLQHTPGTSSQFDVNYIVYSRDGLLYRDYGVRSSQKPGPSAVVTEALDISDWPLGEYRLSVIAEDRESGQADTASVTIYKVDPTLQPVLATTGAAYKVDPRLNSTLTAENDPWDTLSTETRANVTWYLLSPRQRQVLEDLTDSGKVNFLNQFWAEHDEIPQTSFNEYRLEMIARYNHTLEFFTTDALTRDGWKTDRGRIFMTYGPYDRIKDNHSPRVGNPFTIWYYDRVRGGQIFVFEDQTGYKDFRLVHSTVIGERYDGDWASRLQDEMLDIN